MDRRALFRLIAAGAALATPAALGGTLARGYLAARTDSAGACRMSGFNAAGARCLDLPLPARGHAFALHPERPEALCFARRPGTFAVAIDLLRGHPLAHFTSPADRHFHGHGVYAARGRLLYASENDFTKGRGVIGVYLADEGYRRAGELPAHGVGPHELALLSDRETLVIANGGIATHPDAPGVKLNLPAMAPSLVYIDRRSGRLLERVRLPHELHRLSMRHLCVARDDRVAVAMQYEGPRRDLVPLVGMHRRGRSLVLFDAPASVLRAMQHYCGSVAFDTSGQVVAASAPRGNAITLWDASQRRYLRSVPVADGSGVAPAGVRGHFLATSGRGGAVVLDAGGHRSSIDTPEVAGSRWDNHLAATRWLAPSARPGRG